MLSVCDRGGFPWERRKKWGFNCKPEGDKNSCGWSVAKSSCVWLDLSPYVSLAAAAAHLRVSMWILHRPTKLPT